MQQLELFPLSSGNAQEVELPVFDQIDHWILAFSGGKDSIACLTWLLENVDRSKIEIWHHSVDDVNDSFFDWPCTEGYARAIANAFGIPFYLSWLEKGFRGELMRNNEPHAKTWFQTPSGLMSAGGLGKVGTRRKFPAKTASLKTRWCSSALKIDVSRIAINNQARFVGKTLVVVTGERREESAARSKYVKTQHYCQPNRKRVVYQFRPVLDWSINQVWASIAQYKINPHPAYRLGFGRVSCRTCIFGSPNQWATIRRDFPDAFGEIVRLEEELQHTIDAKRSVIDMANLGAAYPQNSEAIAAANSTNWSEPVFLENWTLPSGAFGEQHGSI